MTKTAVIMSKEEAMALPLNKRPLCFRISSEMYHTVFESIGAASMCWEPTPKGQFDSELASEIATKLCFKIANELEKQPNYFPTSCCGEGRPLEIGTEAGWSEDLQNQL